MPNVKGGDNYNIMKSTHVSRQQLIAESLIRDHIRSRLNKKILEEKRDERRLRSIVRRLLEAETGTDEPSEYTGINVLANLLEKIVPIIEDDFKMLTTSEEQRESFRNHIIQAFKNTLSPIDAATKAEDIPESFVFELDKAFLSEKVKIDLSPEDGDAGEAVAGEFIDIAAPDEQDDFVTVDDQNETGRNFAAVTFNKIEKQTVDAYDMLADEEDKNLFYDYLITNMLLYFDKFEDELEHKLPDSTTPEYEDKKDETAETSVSPDEEESSSGDEGSDPFAGV